MKERIKHLILLVILIAIDQCSKLWVRTSLINQNPIIIIPKILNLQYHENDGAVWGILSGRVSFLIVLTIFILGVIIYAYFKIPKDKKYGALKLLAVFIIAGALGNMIDRIYLGYVVDFIYFEIIDFPLFNVADSYLTVSSLLLFLLAMFYYKEEDYYFLSKKGREAQLKTSGQEADLLKDSITDEEKHNK